MASDDRDPVAEIPPSGEGYRTVGCLGSLLLWNGSAPSSTPVARPIRAALVAEQREASLDSHGGETG